MTGDDHLRTELEALERAAPTGQLPETESSTARTSRRIGLVGATVVAAVALTSLAFGLGRSLDIGSRSFSPSPSGPIAPANPPAIAETRDGDFILTLSSPKTVWTTHEEIEVSASLTYAGDELDMTVGEGAPPIGFTIRSATGQGATVGTGRFRPCIQYPVGRDSPVVATLTKDGILVEEGVPAASPFGHTFSANPDLQLEPGEWEFTASTTFAERTCGDDHQLKVSIVLHVVAPASPSPTPQPSAPGPSATPEVRVCMTALAHGVLDADADGNPILIMEDGLPPVSIVFSYPEDFVIESAAVLTIYDRDGNRLAREGDAVKLGGGFNAGDTIFFACGMHQVLGGGSALQCGLSDEDCDAALAAFGELFEVDDPGLAMVAIGIGRGLRWHAEVHACWLDGRYELVDVFGDAYGPTDDPSASVRSEGWDDPPCELPQALSAPGLPLPSASGTPR